jgi:predicted metal-binding membrane protein
MPIADEFPNLTTGGHLIARHAMRPQMVAIAAICVLMALGVFILALLLVKSESGFTMLAFGKALCGPSANLSNNFVGAVSLSAAIWAAMSFAMMLPAAAPMLVTYAEIVDTAAAKDRIIVSPLVLVAGYLTIWVGFAIIVGVAETLLASYLVRSPEITSVWAGGSLIIAGLYQFSIFKYSCLSRCRHPFAFFFTNWTDRMTGVFKLGLRQGLLCLGCCWALMLTMLTVGSMNLLWMTALAVSMAVEKTTTSNFPSHAIGAGLMLAGAFALFVTFA